MAASADMGASVSVAGTVRKGGRKGLKEVRMEIVQKCTHSPLCLILGWCLSVSVYLCIYIAGMYTNGFLQQEYRDHVEIRKQLVRISSIHHVGPALELAFSDLLTSTSCAAPAVILLLHKANLCCKNLLLNHDE